MNSQITYVDPVNKTKEGQGAIVLHLLIDASDSMKDMMPTVVRTFNGIVIPALQGAADRYVKAFRIGCVAFSDEVVPIINGFRTMEKASRQLNASAFDRSELYQNTKLYGAMISGFHAACRARKELQTRDRITNTRIKLVILTDGANNLEPKGTDGEAKVRALYGIQDAELVQTTLMYFHTDWGVNKPEFNRIANATGCSSRLYIDGLGKSLAEKQATFRHELDIWSRNTVGNLK